MAGIYTLNAQDQSLDTLRIHWQFALARLKSDPNAAAYVADFTAFGTQWAAADQKEHDLDDAVTGAEAAVIAADGVIDKLVDSVSATINGGKKPNPQLPLQQLFFGSQTPSDFKRPILGSQLVNVQKWPALLGQASQPALQAIAAPMTAAVQGGNTAAKALDDALAARSAFRLGGGDRQKAFDTFNSISAKAYGGLKAFAHDHPELGLPSSYAESFFKGSARSPHGQTVTETAHEATKAAAKASKAQAAHDAALQKAAAKAAAAKDLQTKRDAAKAAKKTADDAKKAAAFAAAAAKKKR